MEAIRTEIPVEDMHLLKVLLRSVYILSLSKVAEHCVMVLKICIIE